VEVLTPYLAAQLGGRGITANSLSPGAIDTEMNAGWIRSEEGRQQAMAQAAVKRVSMPDDIADVAAFLASDASRWVTGQRLEASGGAHL
jgi:3-oxoacyl-[acyl-carrier protein] reductase